MGKHRVSFRRAATVFRDPNQLSLFNHKHSQEEDRWITIGVDHGGVLQVVIHTYMQIDENSCEIDIISARKATNAELNQYNEGIS